MCLRHLLLCLLGVIVIVNESEASWDEWWTYDGISGPSFWGLINPQWYLCSKGRRQSPINIEPDKLLFDRHLRPVSVDKHKVSGHLYNTGQFLVFRADREAKVRVNITGGPLAYHYQFEEIYIHYGMDNDYGSEHRINNYAFPAEIQVYGFNAELYHNMSEAQHKSQGLVAISLMVQIGETLHPELQIITSVFNKVKYRGDFAPVRHLSLKSLLPNTNDYMTYEGSTTHPGCWETAVWLILNKPIYVTARELYALRQLMQGPSTTPKAPLGNNSRPLQDLHYRTIRTNIDFHKRPDAKCPSMAQDMHYRDDFFFPANTWQDDGSLSHNGVV
ncbi:carbonic anhydrase-related protein 10 isoform X2 [Bombus affinis]|uniref:Carbonic anhydrase-related protein 10 isoform X2 n=3 Tax=Bombus TaxID=28641 RepID=A0A9B2JKD7_BOMTE|nr:carbonic anhydrase-related protein 10 isoform X2 [Bombus terrestris]XP_012249346.1 carbonic anhydrase-related protein 10 isoform X2 [Bombus impatiens]XP_033190174.1 carbonic anhydrase-related protein 10 isoform X2 [Bombus vancouverensis nearcticus]XP_033306132.1 carbonic anhydrase-related protein 10 isoform X2 [Bombus bifarius]XP_043594723.1 carbonic anhydrase-related protein 10 isoform X2 [Bombus pyrosoma]XP_050470176.1 carbonic anhydrase-related protein 10 isoform X2 [Bombus huntii]XP_05